MSTLKLPPGYSLEPDRDRWNLKTPSGFVTVPGGWFKRFHTPESAASYAHMHAAGQRKENSVQIPIKF